MAHRRPQPRELIAAGIGFGVIFLFVSGASVFSYVAGTRTEHEARQTVTATARSAWLVGQVGEELSRIHADVLEALTEPPDTVGPIAERIARVNRELDLMIAELEPRLTIDEVAQWKQIAPIVHDLRHDFAQALRDIEAGRAETAERLLDRDALMAAMLFEWLERLSDTSRLAGNHAVEQMDADIAAAARLQMFSFVALLFCVLLVGLAVARQLRRQQRALTEYLDRVESANRDLEAFAGRVAHDFNTILTPILLMPRMLQKSSGNPQSVLRLAGRIEASTRRAVHFLEGLLAFAKAGRAAEGVASSVDGELQYVLQELLPLTEQMVATVEIEVAPDAVVACASSLLHAVLLNLLSNALKFLEGRERRWVGVRAFMSEGRCVLEIADSGPGIRRDALRRIFEPFYRVPGGTIAGSGIGLATVQRIVTAHTGVIEVESTEGVGTRVRVRMPGATMPALEKPAEVAVAPSELQH